MNLSFVFNIVLMIPTSACRSCWRKNRLCYAERWNSSCLQVSEVMLPFISFPHIYSMTLFTCFLVTSNCLPRTPVSLLQFEMTALELATVLHLPQHFNRKLRLAIQSVGDSTEHKQTPAHKEPYWTASGPWKLHYLWSLNCSMKSTLLKFRIKTSSIAEQRSLKRP